MIRPLSMLAVLFTLGLSIPAFAADVEVFSGGVGEQERAALDAKAGGFPLKIELIGKDGMYLSNVAISIRNAEGVEVVNHTAQGPFVFVNLPAGAYHVGLLAADGASQKEDVTVGAEQKTLHIRFPNTES